MKILTTMLLIFFGFLTYGQVESLTVIGNTKGCPSEMNQSELKSVFLGEKQRWRSGNKVSLSLIKYNTEAGKYICQKVYNMDGDELQKYWMSLVFQGKAEAPVFFSNAIDVQAFVSENPGAIGIIDYSPQAPGVQVVLIDGKKSL